MSDRYRVWACAKSGVLAAVGVGGLLGVASGALAQSVFPIKICEFCYDYSDTVTICDHVFCWSNAGCTGQVCQANDGLTVRACCNSCPDDDWQDTCDGDPQ